MKGWLRELKDNCAAGDDDLIIHVVGTKSDIVAADPSARRVPFERTIAYVAEQLHPSRCSTPPLGYVASGGSRSSGITSPSAASKRSSGFWGQDVGWDSCHEVNARDGEGIEELFRVIASGLVSRRNKEWEKEQLHAQQTPGKASENGEDYFSHARNTGSFRVGYGDKRRSWLGLPTSVAGLGIGDGAQGVETRPEEARRKGRCC